MVTFIIGDLLTGRRIQTLPVLAGSWSEVINDSGTVTATVSLRNPLVKRLHLEQSAAVGKAFIAAVEGDTILQAGPIWDQTLDDDKRRLTLSGAGLLSYFDHRALLPVLAGRLPSDPTTDTRYMPFSAPGTDYPWPTDTTRSLQGIMVGILAQALTWPSGNVPLTLPSPIAGTSQRAYRGADVAPVGSRVRELASVLNGPDVRLTPQWTTDRLGIQWVGEIGTPTQPLIFSPQRSVFYIGVPDSSVTKLKVQTSGLGMAAQAFAVGGRAVDQSLVSVSTNAALLAAGYAQLDAVDSSHSTVQDLPTVQTYSDEIVKRGAVPEQTWTFTHKVAVQPYLTSFRAGDFADVRVTDHPYLTVGTHSMRLLARSGDAKSKTVDLTFAPELM